MDLNGQSDSPGEHGDEFGQPVGVLRVVVEQVGSGIRVVNVEIVAHGLGRADLPERDTLVPMSDWDACVRSLRQEGWRLASGGEFVSATRRIWKFRRTPRA